MLSVSPSSILRWFQLHDCAENIGCPLRCAPFSSLYFILLHPSQRRSLVTACRWKDRTRSLDWYLSQSRAFCSEGANSKKSRKDLQEVRPRPFAMILMTWILSLDKQTHEPHIPNFDRTGNISAEKNSRLRKNTRCYIRSSEMSREFLSPTFENWFCQLNISDAT